MHRSKARLQRPAPAIAPPRRALLLASVLLVLLGGPPAMAQNGSGAERATPGVPSVGAAGITRTTAEMMEREAAAAGIARPAWREARREFQPPDREFLAQDPGAADVASSAKGDPGPVQPAQTGAIGQTLGTSFTGATLADTGTFPPDTMGAAGPAQFIVFVNGRVRSFDKASGTADGALDVDSDAFFSPVMSPVPGGGINFTAHPQVRYDRLTKRWILAAVDVPSSTPFNLGDIPNRLVLAVSDSASNGVIAAATAWTFYFVQQNTVGGIPSNGQFLDNESLGVDANALYVGGNMFSTAASAFVECSAFVIRKSSILSGGPIVTTAFRHISGGVTDGPFAPRGVDNYDPAATEGYFIGVSAVAFGRLNLRRISTPGGTPAISADIPITVPSTSTPISVDHLGDTGGTNGNLDAVDDRLLTAHIRNGRLWTAHNIAVTSAGVASSSQAERRNAVRWYELVIPAGTGTPTVNQSGTIFDSAATVAAARQYWMPSIAVSGQGHAGIGFSTAGTPYRADAATAGRMAGDALTTMGPVALFTSSVSGYNPPGDPGGAAGRRWGDQSFTSVDPADDMTLWTIQEFADASNSYAVRVVKLRAPPPATPTSASASVPVGSPSAIVTITGTPLSGSGFFDPGAGFSNRLSASVTGGVTVNSVTFTNATHLVLNLSTVGATAGARNLTVTNPDGQSIVANALIVVTSAPPAVVTGGATAIGASTATLAGTANPNGTATTAGFQYGPTIAYGSTTAMQAIGSGAAAVPIGGGAITGLACATQYYYRAVATNPSGTTNGAGETFTTVASFSLSATSAAVPAGAGSGSVTLTAGGASCAWTAVTNHSFVAVTSPGAGTGSATITWSISANPSTSPRIGTISIAGLTLTITQAGASLARRVPNDFNHDGLSDLGVFRPIPGRWLIAGRPNTDWGVPGDLPVAGDFNGDGSPDVAVFRPANGTWYISGGAIVPWGAPGDIPVPGDYDGNGTTDIAVFRPSTGVFYVRNGASVAWGLAGDLPVIGDYDGDGVDDIAVYRPATGTWYVRNILTAVFGFAADIPVPADYNGDGRTDIAVFRPSIGTWMVKDQYAQIWGTGGDVPVPMDRNGDGLAELGVFRRATGTFYFKNHVTDGTETVVFGAAGDIPLNRAMPPVQTKPGDFDGDRKADLTVFRPSTGDWVSLRSLSGMTNYTLRSFGATGDVPVGRDFDGDGKLDFAVYRPSLGRWFVLQSSTSFTAYAVQDWGLATDTPVPADYDGDGKADFAVYRPSLGRWVILLSSTNNTSYVQHDWGLSGDIPAPADYDGDGRTDLGVFRPSTGRWLVLNRVTGAVASVDWGLPGDVPAAADFDGDGKADVAVYRPSLGRWLILSAIDGSYQSVDWGLSGDTVVPSDYDGDGKADIAVFRPSNGTWYVRGLFNRSWGLTGDIPALKNP